ALRPLLSAGGLFHLPALCVRQLVAVSPAGHADAPGAGRRTGDDFHSRTPRAIQPAPMSFATSAFGGRLRRAVARLATFALLVVAGVIAAKYVIFERLDEGIRSRVEAELRTHYRQLEVRVK